MRASARYFWLLAAWIFFVVLLSMLPLPVKNSLRTHGRFHYFAHFASFLVTVCVAGWRKNNFVWIATSCLGAIGLGLFVECTQTAVYGNDFEWDDVTVDSLGAMTGAAILAYRGLPKLRGKKVICNPAVKSRRGGPRIGTK